MIITKKGTIAKSVNPIWHGISGKCWKCKTEFVLENGDDVTVGMERRVEGQAILQVRCPTCDEMLIGDLLQKGPCIKWAK